MEHETEQKPSGLKNEGIPIRKSDQNLFSTFFALNFDYFCVMENKFTWTNNLPEYIFDLSTYILPDLIFYLNICFTYLNNVIKKQP